MEPLSIGIVGAVVFGLTATLAIFIRQLILSRDKSLNDRAHRKILNLEKKSLAQIRQSLEDGNRFEAHFKMIEYNKEFIQYLDDKINDILKMKLDMVAHYASSSINLSETIIKNELSEEKKFDCDKIRGEIDKEIERYNIELKELQTQRSDCLKDHRDLQKSLIHQENLKNDKLDSLYVNHTGLLEKIYLKYNDNFDQIALKNIEAGSRDFDFFAKPFKFLILFFSKYYTTKNVATKTLADEITSRQQVAQAQQDIIDTSPNNELSDEKSDSNVIGKDAAIDFIN